MRARCQSERVPEAVRAAAVLLLSMLAPAASAAAPVGAAVPASEPSVADQADAPVPTIVVTPDDAFGESDRKLARLLKSLPGADDAAPVKKSIGEKIGDYYAAHRDPNDLDEDSQQRLSRELNGDPAHRNLQ